jgi:TP901 family phage tail tape measure protein
MNDTKLLKILITATDNASKELKKVSSSIGDIGDKGNSIMGVLGGVSKFLLGLGIAGGTAALAVAGLSVHLATDFQKTLRETSTNLNYSAAQTVDLGNAIKDTMMISPSPMNDIAEAYRTAGSEGFSLAQSQKIIAETNKAAIVTGDSLGSITNATTIAMHDYGASVNDTSKYLGYMHGAMVGGNMTMAQLSPVIGILSNTTHLAGVSFQEAMAGMSMMTQSGASTSEAVTDINNALMHLEVPTAGAKDAMMSLGQAAGVDLIADFKNVKNGSMTLQSAMNDVMKASGGSIDKLHAMIPETRALRFAMAYAGDQGKSFAKDLDQVNDGENALKDSYEANADNLDVLTGIMKNQLQVVLINLGTTFLPILIKAMKFLTDTFAAHREEIQAVIKRVSEFVSEAWDRLSQALTWFVTNIWPKIQTALKEFGSWFSTTGGPGINKFVTETWKRLQDAFNYFVTNIWPKIQPALEDLVNLFMTQVVPAVKELWDNLVKLWNVIGPLIIPILGLLAGALGVVIVGAILTLLVAIKVLATVLSAIVGIVTFVVQQCIVWFNMLRDTFLNVVDFFVNLATGNWQKAWDSFGRVLGGFKNMALGVFYAVKDGILSSLRAIADPIRNFRNSIQGQNFMGVTISLPEIPHFANGVENFKGGVALVGENGPELVTLSPRSTVKTASQTRDILAGSSNSAGGNTININITWNGFFSTDSDIAEMAKRVKRIFAQHGIA